MSIYRFNNILISNGRTFLRYSCYDEKENVVWTKELEIIGEDKKVSEICDIVNKEISDPSSPIIDPKKDTKLTRVFKEKPDKVGVLPADLPYNFIEQ